MEKIDSLGLRLCAYQAELFEKSLTETECSSMIFIRRFMNSAVAQRMDNSAFMFESYDIEDVIDDIENQYGQSDYGKEKLSTNEMYWIGYIYRYWSCIRNKSSKSIYRTINPGQLRKLYFPYHSLDPAQAIERIEESLNLDLQNNDDAIKRGVNILRKVRQRHEK